MLLHYEHCIAIVLRLMAVLLLEIFVTVSVAFQQSILSPAQFSECCQMSLQNILVQINASNLASWYFVLTFYQEIHHISLFSAQNLPGECSAMQAKICPLNNHSDHAACHDYSGSSFHHIYYYFVTVNVILPFKPVRGAVII